MKSELTFSIETLLLMHVPEVPTATQMPLELEGLGVRQFGGKFYSSPLEVGKEGPVERLGE